MAKRYKYTATRKKEAAGGILSLALAAVSCLLLLVSTLVAAAQNGNAAIWLGGAGLISLGLSVYGFLVGLGSLKAKEMGHRWGMIGSLFCGVLAAIWLGIFLTGVRG